MEEKRAKTLEALSAFIESQKALLARTHADIAKLKGLRNDVSDTPDDLCCFSTFGDKLRLLDSTKLGGDSSVVPILSHDLDWSVFSGSDPTPLRALATASRSAYAQTRTPPTKQTSPPSSLQQLVRAKRSIIVDPVLMSLPPLSSDEEDEPPSPEELRKMREREKIRELKKRRILGDGVFYGLSGLGLRKSEVDAVFVRRDQEDESAEVDIGLGDLDVQMATDGAIETAASTSSRDLQMEVDTPPTSVLASDATTPNATSPIVPTSSRTGRLRRPTQKAAHNRKQAGNSSKKKAPPPPPPEDDEPGEREASGSLLDKKGKPRPETYKQAWSVSEQHLLERLLEEIPDGEKNRWLKISQAMAGKRTARQVASRVQKYYEKLKRFGLDVGNSNASSRGNNT